MITAAEIKVAIREQAIEDLAPVLNREQIEAYVTNFLEKPEGQKLVASLLAKANVRTQDGGEA